MARIKNNAEYFSHDGDASDDEKIMMLEAMFGLTGYALYFKMIERLCRCEGFEMDYTEPRAQALAKRFGVEYEEFCRFTVAATSCDIAAFRLENGRLWSDGLKKRMRWLVEKRQRDADRIAQKRASKPENEHNSLINGNVAATSPNKVKESKVKESKEEKETKKEKLAAAAEDAIQSLKAEKEKKLPLGREAAPLPPIAQLSENNPAIKNTYLLSRRLPSERFGEMVEAFDTESELNKKHYESEGAKAEHFLNWVGNKIRIEQETKQRPARSTPAASKSTITQAGRDVEHYRKPQAF